MAAKTRLSARRHGSMPGSLGSYAGEDLGIPIVTVELPRSADRLGIDEAWHAYGAMLLRALRF
jgi:hypothetical protein